MPPRWPLAKRQILDEAPGGLMLGCKWADPDGVDEPTLEHLLARLAWACVLVSTRIGDGRLEVRAMSECPDTLEQLVADVQHGFSPHFSIELKRAGEVDEGCWWGICEPGLEPKERELLDVAIAEGYYDRPRRCGVRELARLVGLSKSTVSRKLGRLEARAVRRLREPPGPG